ncbi:MAG: hypothetical protein OXR72_09695 [Gemmatimonadota bacterium]|nr:hypothetical protein [Gemmatimonadota bacterium]
MTVNWHRITESAPWPHRDSPGAAVFKDHMWLFGGWQMLGPMNFPRLNDVWRSPDGRTWECLSRQAPWPARNLAGCVVLGDRIWLMGGFDGVHTLGDVWCSNDGRHWDCVTQRAPWGCRGAFGSIVYNERIWVLGGLNWERRTHYGDVWCSDDGHRWELIAKRSPWSPRAMFPAIEHGNRMWLLGGGNYHDRRVNYNDVWCTSDGANWKQLAVDAGWAPRRFHGSFVYAGRMWIAGGAIEPSINVNDVWCSGDGLNWRQSHRCAPWGVRHAFPCLDFQRRIWLLGGYSGSIAGSVVYNDVWTLETPESASRATDGNPRR